MIYDPLINTNIRKKMKQFVSSLRAINLSILTIVECINEIANIQEQVSSEIIKKIFLLDATAENVLSNIKNRTYNYFCYFQDSEEGLRTKNDGYR